MTHARSQPAGLSVEGAVRRSQRLSPRQWTSFLKGMPVRPSDRHTAPLARDAGCLGNYLMRPVFSSRMMTRPVVATKVVAAQTMGSAASLVKWAPVM